MSTSAGRPVSRTASRPASGRVALVLLVVAGLVLGGCGGVRAVPPSTAPSPALASGPASGPESGLGVTGYVLEGSATAATITRDGDLVDTVGVDGVLLTGPRRVSPLSRDAVELRDAARRAGRRTVLLVSNYSDALGDFDEPTAYRMLRDRSHRGAVVRALARRAAGFDGLQVDLESLRARDRRGLVALVRELRRALPDHQLSMAFMASGGARGYAARGYDLPRLGRLLDVAVLMAYDQHGPWSGPGPVSSLPWVRRELAYFVSRVPRGKVDLGVAGYGYQWGARPAQVDVASARALAGSRARWSERDGEWRADLPGGRTLWWDDARSFAARRELAAAQGLRGVAVWELGTSGPLAP